MSSSSLLGVLLEYYNDKCVQNLNSADADRKLFLIDSVDSSSGNHELQIVTEIYNFDSY